MLDDIFWKMKFLHALILIGFLVEIRSSQQSLRNADSLVSGTSKILDFSGLQIINDSQILWDDMNNFVLNNMIGISVNFIRPLIKNPNPQALLIIFANSRFDIYDEKARVIDAKRCDAEFFETKDINTFSNLETAAVGVLINTCKQNPPFCPYFFKNARLSRLIVEDFGENHLFQNTFSIYKIKNFKNRTINANLNSLMIMTIYRGHLTRKSFEFFALFSVKTMEVIGSIVHFEKNLFRDFRELLLISLDIEKLGEFFHSSTNEWLATIFNDSYVFKNRNDLVNFTRNSGGLRIQVFLLGLSPVQQTDYFYPDEDLCLFKHFPSSRPVVSSVHLKNTDFRNITTAVTKTTCTYKFLSRNNIHLLHYLQEQNKKLMNCAYFKESDIESCDFDVKLALCFNQTKKHQTFSEIETHFEYPEFLYALDWFEYIGPIISFPIISALAFGLNLLIIIIIRSKKTRKERLFEAKSFRFIELNSVFNCLECVVYQLRLMGICLGTNSVFCSSIRTFTWVVDIGAANHVLSEILKSCSMMLGLLFSIQRYIEASKNGNKFHKGFSNRSMLWFFFLTLLYGVIVSVPVYFTIDFRLGLVNFYDMPGKFLIVRESYWSQKVQSCLFIAHYVINDFVILFVNFVYDLLLVGVIRAELKKKLENKKNMSQNFHLEISEAAKKKLQDEEKKKNSIERKANAMITVFILIYVLCRLPELASMFVEYFFHRIFHVSCAGTLLCYMISNLSEYLYMYSYCFNIVLYYKFNSFFNRGFKHYFTKRKI